jgi:hypothetical protein
LHEVHLLATGVEPVAAEPEVRARQHRATERIPVERERFVFVAYADRNVMDAAGFHRDAE